MSEQTRPPSWHALAADAVQRELATGPGGLDPAEANQRLQQYGPNRL
ncbi:hypothetical protein EIZ87_25500, partial [Escherichia coli]|nr:hypothetical protein [Escherichia coli]